MPNMFAEMFCSCRLNLGGVQIALLRFSFHKKQCNVQTDNNFFSRCENKIIGNFQYFKLSKRRKTLTMKNLQKK